MSSTRPARCRVLLLKTNKGKQGASTYTDAIARVWPSAQVTYAPVLTVRPLPPPDIHAALAAVGPPSSADAVVITSAAAVDALEAAATPDDQDDNAVSAWLSGPAAPPLWTLGYASAAAAERAGGVIDPRARDAAPRTGTELALALVEALGPDAAVVHLAGSKTRHELRDILHDAGLSLSVAPIYAAVPEPTCVSAALAEFAAECGVPTADVAAAAEAPDTAALALKDSHPLPHPLPELVVVVFSPRGARILLDTPEWAFLRELAWPAALVAIGPTTAQALRSGLSLHSSSEDASTVHVRVADVPTPDGVAAALESL